MFVSTLICAKHISRPTGFQRSSEVDGHLCVCKSLLSSAYNAVELATQYALYVTYAISLWITLLLFPLACSPADQLPLYLDSQSQQIIYFKTSRC